MMKVASVWSMLFDSKGGRREFDLVEDASPMSRFGEAV